MILPEKKIEEARAAMFAAREAFYAIPACFTPEEKCACCGEFLATLYAQAEVGYQESITNFYDVVNRWTTVPDFPDFGEAFMPRRMRQDPVAFSMAAE